METKTKHQNEAQSCCECTSSSPLRLVRPEAQHHCCTSTSRGTTPLLQPPTKVTNTTAGNGTSSDGDMKTNQSAKSSCWHGWIHHLKIKDLLRHRENSRSNITLSLIRSHLYKWRVAPWLSDIGCYLLNTSPVLLYVTFHPYVEFVYMYKHPELKSNVSLYVCAVQ